MNETFSATDKACPNCGVVVAADSRFCKHCAFDFAAPPQALPQTSAPGNSASGKNRYLWPAVGLAAVLALAAGAAWFYRSRQTAPPTVAAAPSQVMTEKAKQIEARILQGATVGTAELAGLSSYELRVLRNVNFARYGRVYDRPGLGDYFSTRPWYKPSSDYNDKLLTATDKTNVSLILAEENKAKAAEAAATTTVPAVSTAAGSPLIPQPAGGGGASSPNSPSSATVNAAISMAAKVLLNEAGRGDWQTTEVKNVVVQITRQGDYNEEQKYMPVQATVTGASRREPEFWMGNGKPTHNCQFSFSTDFKIQKNDYGDWLATVRPFWRGPVQVTCDK